MDNEKYGIELELVVNKFKEKMQQVKNAFKGISDKKINITANNAQLRYLKAQIEEIQYLLAKADKGFEVGDVLKLEANLERLTNQYNKLISQQNKLNTNANKTNNNISKGFDKMTSKIKRFGLALLSIRSIYSLVSRASSAYLSQDTELANKLQAVWVGLGSLLSPIIEGIANILLKAVQYINVFITALTGVDLLAKATAKSLNKTTGSAKGLSKALAGFDELTNLDTDISGGAGIDTSWTDAFKNIDIDMTWADKIKEIGTWIRDNFQTIISGIMGIAGAILAVKLGIDGIKALGVGIMIYAGINLLSELKKYLDVLNPALENNGTSFMQFGNIVKYIGLAVVGLGLIIGGIPAIITGVIITIVGVIIKYWDNIKEFLQKGIDWFTGLQENVKNWFINNIDTIYEKFGFFGVGLVAVVTGTFNWIVEIIKGAIGIVINVFDGLFTGIKQIFDGILMIFRGDFKNGFINIGKGIVNILIGILNGLISGINAIVYPIRALIVGIGKVMGKSWTMDNITIPKIPKLEVGTNYVPEDQLAMIHKGEAVVPKKFNSREYLGRGNEETNSKLDDLIEAVRNIEINPYTTIKDVGKASLNYINSKSRQLGESVVV